MIVWKKMTMMNCFCGIIDCRKAFSLISSRDHCQRYLLSRVSDTPRAGFELVQNLSSGFVEWSCAAVIITKPRRQNSQVELSYTLSKQDLKESCVPDCWKVSFVFPVFKNIGEKSTARNYQVVSLLSVVSKVLKSFWFPVLFQVFSINCRSS